MNSNEQIGELTQELFNAIEFGNERARTACDKVEDFMCQQAEQMERLEVLLAALHYHGFEYLSDCEQDQICEIEAKLKKENEQALAE